MVDLFDNQDVVLRLVQKTTAGGDEVQGKKALQKSIYFFNLHHKCFYYKWADYGPFSGEVQQIVADFIYGKKIEVTPTETKKQGATKLLMKYKYGDNPDFNKIRPEFDKALDSVVKFVKGKSPRDLELLASVHFLADMQWESEKTYDLEWIFARLSLLKPKANFVKEDVKDSIRTLQENGYLDQKLQNPPIVAE